MKIARVILPFIVFSVFLHSCNQKDAQNPMDSRADVYYPNSKPFTRWWWFATEIKEKDVRYQLEWAKAHNFGGVEICWLYPLYRYQKMYARNNNRHYPKDTTAQQWLSPEWSEIVTFTKQFADSIEMGCDFTYGSAWVIASNTIDPKHGTKIYGDTSFKHVLNYAWTWPEEQLVINHLDAEAFAQYSKPMEGAIKPALTDKKNALFIDSWEIKLNGTNKIWTPGFDSTFEAKFGYDIIPFMEAGLDSFPDVRYDYMMHLEEYVLKGFYKPFVEKCKELGAWSRVQCLASPTDVMTTYSLVDIPESEAMLNNPGYSRLVSSSACLASKPLVSCETFTCMYGFPNTYLRQEQIADLKMLADGLFAEGINHHIYHGMPFNPKGSDTIEFFATTYIGPGSGLSKDLPELNNYIGKVSHHLSRGKTFTDVAVYVPYEDGVMKGPYPAEKRRVWVWGEYELRFIHTPKDLEGHHPLWINRHFLENAEVVNGRLVCGDASFSALYMDVDYMDERTLKKLILFARKGLPICLKKTPSNPTHKKSGGYARRLIYLQDMPTVHKEWSKIKNQPPLIEGDSIPPYWCRTHSDGSATLFLAQWSSKGLAYPLYSGQSFSNQEKPYSFTLNYNGASKKVNVVFKPYQSLLLHISKKGDVKEIDITYIPKDPVIRPKEPQNMNF